MEPTDRNRENAKVIDKIRKLFKVFVYCTLFIPMSLLTSLACFGIWIILIFSILQWHCEMEMSRKLKGTRANQRLYRQRSAKLRKTGTYFLIACGILMSLSAIVYFSGQIKHNSETADFFNIGADVCKLSEDFDIYHHILRVLLTVLADMVMTWVAVNFIETLRFIDSIPDSEMRMADAVADHSEPRIKRRSYGSVGL